MMPQSNGCVITSELCAVGDTLSALLLVLLLTDGDIRSRNELHLSNATGHGVRLKRTRYTRTPSVGLLGKNYGRAARVLSVSLDKRPHRTVVLLDASGSMGYGPLKGRPWELALKIASNIAESNSENAPLALIIYSDKVHEQVNFGQGTPEVRTRLKAIRADPTYIKKNIKGRRTATFDAMLAALRF
jgi:hypothetical protein